MDSRTIGVLRNKDCAHGRVAELRAGGHRTDRQPRSGSGRPPGFVPGLFLGFGNPKAYAAMAALFSGFVLVRDRPVADVAVKTAVLVAIMVVVDWIWLLVGSALTRSFGQPVLGRAIN